VRRAIEISGSVVYNLRCSGKFPSTALPSLYAAAFGGGEGVSEECDLLFM
jgi:hypothetical protein